MGKSTLVVLAVTFGLAGFGRAEAQAKPKLARVLPAHVKATHPYSRHSRRNGVQYAEAAEEKQPRVKPSPMALIGAFGEHNALGSRYLSRTVFFWRSSERLPDSYVCDEETLEIKRREAEARAMEKCRASGELSCHPEGTKILKQGHLRCEDIPGASCEKSAHYAGCVAAALVIGSKSENIDL